MSPAKKETRSQKIAAAYRRLFDGSHADGNLILEDLATQCQLFNAKQEIGKETLQWWEGRRSIFLRILHQGRRNAPLARVIELTNWEPGGPQEEQGA